MRNSNDHVKSSLDSRVGDVDVETAEKQLGRNLFDQPLK